MSLTQSGCKVWEGSRIRNSDGSGYGNLGLKLRGKWKNVLAHRYALCLHRGIPLESIKNLDVLHKCDNPPCINPEHLYLGTHKQNMKDRDSRGRQVAPRGSSNGNSKLTELEATEILQSCLSAKDLAGKYEVHRSTIDRIRRGKTWERTLANS